jgi:hypothetical protein
MEDETMIDWTEKLDPTIPWRVAYADVATVVRAWLLAHPIAETNSISTHELVEGLFPAALAKGAGIVARRRLYKALMAQTTRDLADCCSRGPLQPLHGHGKSGPKIRPWRWHQPTTPNPEQQVKNRCSQCGQEYPVTEPKW